MLHTVLFHRRVEKKLRQKSLPRAQVAKCVSLLAQGRTEGIGLRMKRLKGIDLPVFEARVNDDVRLIFTKQPAYTYSEDGTKHRDHLTYQIVVWDVDHHDDALKAAGRTSYDSLRQAEYLNLAALLHTEGVLEEMEISKLPEYPTVPISVVQSAVKTAKNVLPQYMRLHYRGEEWWMEQAINAERESLYDAQEFVEIDLDRIEEEIERIAHTDEDFLLRLLPEQMQFVRRTGPLLLSGTVGSGKTTIMLYHLYRQARANPAGRYLVVTYSPTLTALCQMLFEHLPRGRELLQRVDILSYEDLLRRLVPDRQMLSYAERRQQFHEAYQRLKEAWKLANFQEPLRSLRKQHKQLPWDEETLWAEYWDVLKGQLNWYTSQLLDRDGYLRSAKSDFSTQEREYLFEVMQTWFNLEGKDELDLTRELWETRAHLEQMYDGVYVDEIQDLCEVQWMLLIRLVKHQAGLFLTGDPFQALRPSGFHWKRLVARLSQAVTVQEGSLQLNLRNSRQIARFVQRELERVSKDYGLHETPDYHVTALLDGLPPASMLLENHCDTPMQTVAEWLGDQGAVLVWDGEHKSHPSAQQFARHGALLCTVDEAKGLEFDRVVLLNIYGALQEQMKQSTVIRQQALSRLYVALTRARRGMVVVETSKKHLPPRLHSVSDGWWKVWQSIQPVMVRSVEALRSPILVARRWEREGQYLDAARCYEQMGDYANALRCYEQAKDYANAARCYEQMGDYVNAVRCYEQAGDAQSVARCWGLFYQKQTNWVEAVKWFERAGLPLHAAYCYEQLRDYPNAARCYEQAKDYANAARCHEQLRDYPNAARCYEQAKDYANAARCYKRAKNYANAARCYEQMGDYANAARCYEQVGDVQSVARCWGLFYEQQKNWVEAAKWFGQAGLPQRAAYCYEQVGDYANAARCHEQVRDYANAARCHEQVRDYANAARCHEQAGGYGKAARCYEQAGDYANAARCHEQVGDYANAARCHEQVGDYANAARCHEQVGDYANAARCHEQVGDYANAARCYEQMGDYANAARCYEQAGDAQSVARCWGLFYQKQTNWVEAAKWFGQAGLPQRAAYCYEQVGDYANAARCYEQAKDYANALRCYEQAKDYANAARCYEQAKDYANGARCYEQLRDYANAARCYEQMGDYVNAVRCYEQAGDAQSVARCWGLFYQKQTNWVEAAKWFGQAGLPARVAYCYKQVRDYANAARCYEQAKDYANAARCYEQAKDYENAARCYKQVGYHIHEARCYERIKDYANAARCYELLGWFADAARCRKLALQGRR